MTLTKRGNKYAMVLVDHFTKFVNAYAITNMEATTIADKLINHMMRFGIVEQLLSDLGTQLQSQVLELVYDALGIQRLRTTAYHPECDGISERFVQTMKSMLSTLVNEKCDNWDDYLDAITYEHIETCHHGIYTVRTAIQSPTDTPTRPRTRQRNKTSTKSKRVSTI